MRAVSPARGTVTGLDVSVRGQERVGSSPRSAARTRLAELAIADEAERLRPTKRHVIGRVFGQNDFGLGRVRSVFGTQDLAPLRCANVEVAVCVAAASNGA